MKKLILLSICIAAALSVHSEDRWQPTNDRLIRIDQRARKDWGNDTVRQRMQASKEYEALSSLYAFRPSEISKADFEKIADIVEAHFPQSYQLQYLYLQRLCLDYLLKGHVVVNQ